MIWPCYTRLGESIGKIWCIKDFLFFNITWKEKFIISCKFLPFVDYDFLFFEYIQEKGK